MVVASIGSALEALIILIAIHWKLPLYVFMIGACMLDIVIFLIHKHFY